MSGANTLPAPARPMMRIQLGTGVQVVASGTLTDVLLDTISFQTDPSFALVSNNIQVPYAGVYYVKGCVKFQSNADTLERLARIKNTTTAIVIGQVDLANDNSGGATEVRCWTVCAAGDQLTLACRQASGAINTLGSGSDGTNCSLVAEYLGVLS